MCGIAIMSGPLNKFVCCSASCSAHYGSPALFDFCVVVIGLDGMGV